MRIIATALLIGAMIINSVPAYACTLWGANGTSVDGGGSIIVKNRDWLPDHQQGLKMVQPVNGYKYFGLYALNGGSPGLKAGINEKGLTVVSATAGSIPAKTRKEMEHTSGLLTRLLKSCSSVDEVLLKQQYFVGPEYIMVADKSKVAYIEIGPEGKYAVKVVENGATYHTNHYLEPSMTAYNQKIGRSSQTRYDRIGQLLNNAKTPYTFNEFIAFSHDENAGPDNSIFRTGSTVNSTRTVATWAVRLPKDKSPELYVRIMNPDSPAVEHTYIMDDLFNGK